MLRAAQILHPNGYFQMFDSNGTLIPAVFESSGLLAKGSMEDLAEDDQILSTYNKRIRTFVIDKEGNPFSFEEVGLDEQTYIADHWKSGYANLPYKVVYEILPNSDAADASPDGYIIPVSGFGLWDAIAGYLAVKSDGIEVLGIAWYWHMETPGLGAEISEPAWQKQFPGKLIVQKSSEGEIDMVKSPIGITVVRGSVADVYGESPKAQSAVDGMAGATLTGVGVTKAYKDTLEAYRPFLISLNNTFNQNSEGSL
jgi:Na+-transporting NADH:ubiquinone oxidoreductase subunit C